MAADRRSIKRNALVLAPFIVGVFLVSLSAPVMLSSGWGKIDLDRAWEGSDSVAMVLDKDGHPNVVYLAYDPHGDLTHFNTDLTYAHIEGDSVERVKLADLTDDDCEMDIVVDRQGAIHLCAGLFHDERIVYARNVDGHWDTSDIALEGYCSSLKVAVDPENHVQIMYVEWVGYQDSQGQDFFRQCLRQLTLDDNGNHTTTITETEVNGGWLTVDSFEIDSEGFIHMLYTYMNYSGPSGGYLFYHWLYYLTNRGGTWSNFTFVNGSTVYPGRSSLALDSEEKVHICYYKPTGDTLEVFYSNNTAGGWKEESIGPGGNVGSSSSIALGKEDAVHVLYFISNLEGPSYASSMERTLMYAMYRDGAIDGSTVQKDMTGYFKSIDVAVGPNGRIHMAYHCTIRHPPSDENPEGSTESFTRYRSSEGTQLVSGSNILRAAVVTIGSCAALLLVMRAYTVLKSRLTSGRRS